MVDSPELMKENTDVWNTDFVKITYLGDILLCISRLVERNCVRPKRETRPRNI